MYTLVNLKVSPPHIILSLLVFLECLRSLLWLLCLIQPHNLILTSLKDCQHFVADVSCRMPYNEGLQNACGFLYFILCDY